MSLIKYFTQTLLSLFICFFASSLHSQTPTAILSGDLSDYDSNYGVAVDLHNDYLIVGAPEDPAPVTDGGGEAYIYRLEDGQWNEVANLYDPYAYFGRIVAINNRWAAIAGAVDVHIYERIGEDWEFHSKVHPSVASFFESFSLTEDKLAIGLRTRGQVEVFHYDGSSWNLEGTLTASDSSNIREFGWKVSLVDNSLIVSSPKSTNTNGVRGAIYIFEYLDQGWVETDKISPPQDESNNASVSWVTATTDKILASGQASYEGEAETAFFFFDKDESGWHYSQTVFTRNPELLRNALALAISERYALIGGEAAFGGESAFYLLHYRAGQWRPLQDFPLHPDKQRRTWEIAISGNSFVAGIQSYDRQYKAVHVYSDFTSHFTKSDFKDGQPRTETNSEIIEFKNFPNPFNPITTVQYNLDQDSQVSLKIYDVSGAEIITLVNGFQVAGDHSVVWDGRNSAGVQVASGIYLYTLRARKFVQTKKMLLAR